MNKLLKGLPITKISTNTYYVVGNGLCYNKAIHFDSCVYMAGPDRWMDFPELEIAVFSWCSANYTWEIINKDSMPKIKHIVLDTPHYESVYHRFKKNTDVNYYIASKYFHPINPVDLNLNVCKSDEIKNALSTFEETDIEFRSVIQI